ncbi:ATP-binding cassette sub-family A member 5 [Araneus ventricosus]|uniref:ATP-binding cassette sub-family A member 5 n=1 Tax=Araneus ventricosus TaxID=182803 RepID=A0A4Y2B7D4_ARAVE|nr:ATP-binding cassette sub-family A member 5 [Araneus ventricosus]
MKIVSRVLAPDEGKITTSTTVNLGVCPQENILHDDLNSTEHLQVFGSLKGIPDAELDSKVTALLQSFDLLSKRYTRSKVLSGGQKRKLCVAIAMIGDPEVLLLDEPSSGMSPHSRKQLWNMLQEYTESGHSVLFTTHYMDEAELLSDRIALLNYGKMKYYGTTMDVKKQFGGGYNVRITLQSEPSLYCKSELVSLISDLPSKPKVTLTSDSEIVVKLHSFHASHCIEFFSKIEEQYEDVGPDCFTISISGLEEIFSLLADENSEQISDEKSTARQIETEIPEFTYASSIWTNVNELARARCRVLIRSSYTLFPIILPVLLLSWNRLFVATRQITDISHELYKNDIIQLINKSGKPLTDFEISMSKLDMKLELVKSAVGVGEKNFIKTQIRNYGFFNERLDVDWNWTVSLSSPYALPAMQNLMSNILWKTWNDELGREVKISIEPITIIEQNLSFYQSETFFTLMHISFCLIFVALAFGLEVVKEKEKKVIWLISTTRNNALPYWISTFIAHLALISLSFIVIQNMLLIFGVYVFQKFSLWIAFYLSMPGCLLFVYLMGQCFKSYRSADIGMTFSVVVATMTLFIAFLIGVVKDIPYIHILNILTLFLIPIYAPFGLIILLCEGEAGDSVTDGSQWIIVCCLVIPLSCLFYSSLIIYLGKWKTFKRKEKIKVMNEEDWDVIHNPKSTVVLRSVRKTYASIRCSRKKQSTVAIKDLTMSFHEGEIFALMGSNGAGKSTLMKLLSLNVGLTSGEIFIRDKYMEPITYCAEENTIWPNLTVEEHLRLFAALNGVPIKYADKVANSLMKDLGMESHAKKRARHLSGGNQRKLSIALSLLGDSNLVLLDEPTTGMDPVSKQHLWKKLHQEFPAASDRTLILTTHSSNEAEVNCSRIGLFMDGNLRCLGTSQALKKEFNKGYELTVRLRNEDNQKFNSFLESEIPEVFEKSRRGVKLQYYIPTQAFKSMSELFMAVGKIQAFKGIEDCFISECSLDQIILDFLSQANTQITGDDECAV